MAAAFKFDHPAGTKIQIINVRVNDAAIFQGPARVNERGVGMKRERPAAGNRAAQTVDQCASAIVNERAIRNQTTSILELTALLVINLARDIFEECETVRAKPCVLKNAAVIKGARV